MTGHLWYSVLVRGLRVTFKRCLLPLDEPCEAWEAAKIRKTKNTKFLNINQIGVSRLIIYNNLFSNYLINSHLLKYEFKILIPTSNKIKRNIL